MFRPPQRTPGQSTRKTRSWQGSCGTGPSKHWPNMGIENFEEQLFIDRQSRHLCSQRLTIASSRDREFKPSIFAKSVLQSHIPEVRSPKTFDHYDRRGTGLSCPYEGDLHMGYSRLAARLNTWRRRRDFIDFWEKEEIQGSKYRDQAIGHGSNHSEMIFLR